ncbi:HNH endonuclease [Helicobacter cetorum]|uniref:HNH endonuclease signature motif containing protein n=1 Tax=Helicobacter cetorum TaxID=138563 RepID=UPI000CF0D7D5|nr:HNH endonuclease [Helicobacter cetorum]
MGIIDVDTKEVRQVVKKSQSFESSLFDKTKSFISVLEQYHQVIEREYKEIQKELEKAQEELKDAQGLESLVNTALSALQGAFILAPGPWKLVAMGGVEAAKLLAKSLMKENMEKCKKNVELLKKAHEIYHNQVKKSGELLKSKYQESMGVFKGFVNKHHDFLRRLNKASEIIENDYNIPPPHVTIPIDIQRLNENNKPFIHTESEHSLKLSSLEQDFITRLQADLNDKIGATNNQLNSNDLETILQTKEQEFIGQLTEVLPKDLSVFSYHKSLELAKESYTKSFKQALENFKENIQENPNDTETLDNALETLEEELNKTREKMDKKLGSLLSLDEKYKKQALSYKEFLQKNKESFITDFQNKHSVVFNEMRLAEFPSAFSVVVPLENLSKTMCCHYALMALQETLKERSLDFKENELDQITQLGLIPKGYLWHFDANVLGNLALVREELLLGVKHTKGYPQWIQFLQLQK